MKGKNIVLRSTNSLEPDVVANTVIDGNLAGSVVTFAGSEDETCVLSGFTIQNGGAVKGGGIYGGAPDSPSRATIENNFIRGNEADGEWPQLPGGGGLAFCDGTIRNNVISGNFGKFDGALAFCDGTVHNNAISGNSGMFGGGLSTCNGIIRTNSITGNFAVWEGGGLDDCNGTILNNTITANKTRTGGVLSGCRGTIQNCIIWANEATVQDNQIYDSRLPTFSCIQDWNRGGEGNIAQDPGFAGPDEADNDYRLLPNSPCIHAGNNSVLVPPGMDLDANLRIAFGRTSLRKLFAIS